MPSVSLTAKAPGAVYSVTEQIVDMDPATFSVQILPQAGVVDASDHTITWSDVAAFLRSGLVAPALKSS